MDHKKPDDTKHPHGSGEAKGNGLDADKATPEAIALRLARLESFCRETDPRRADKHGIKQC